VTEPVGTLLWELRTAGGWSQGKLAKRAGVSKAALSQWESGARQPRVEELEAVLDALGTDAAGRAFVFAHIEAPRAFRHLRATADPGLGPPPAAGDLLRAMRLRKGWTQEQAAARVGVVRSAVAHWERGDRLPAPEQLQALCYALGAREEELVALTTGRFSAAPAEVPASREEEEAYLEGRLRALLHGARRGLEELSFLALEREAWTWAMREAAQRPLLARAFAGHAQFYQNEERWDEVGPLAQRALAAMPGPDPTAATFLWAVILNASAAARGGPRPAPRQGFRLLAAWVERSALPEFTAWMLSAMGKYAARAGETVVALPLANKACQVAEACDPWEQLQRRVSYGEQLLDAGCLEEALEVLPERGALPDHDSLDHLMALAELHWQMGNQSEAQACLQHATRAIAARGPDRCRRRAAVIARRLKTARAA
jgi:transcriptional regulator with XRE-family HTH domain